jgi:hypothetical protein
MKIAIYYHKIEAIGGVEKSILELSKLYKDYDLTIIYSDFNSNTDLLIKLSRYANIKHIDIVKDELFDICFHETIRQVNINALQHKLIINNNWLDCGVTKKQIPNYYDEYIAVGNECKNQAEMILNQEVKVIPNMIDTDEIIKLAN